MSRSLTPDAFQYHGRAIHLSLKSLSDLDRVLQLDDVHWLATTAPVGDFLLPPAFLTYLDADDDGRITADDVRKAIAWLRSRSTLDTPSAQIPCDQISAQSATDTWDKIVRTFKLPEDKVVSLKTVRECRAKYTEDPANFGSGSLTPRDVDDADQTRLLEVIQDSVEPNKESVTEEQLDAFLEQATEVLDWRGASPGEDSWAQEYPIFKSLAPKLKEYFLLSDTAHYTGEQPEVSWPEHAQDERLKEELKGLPLALPLDPEKLDFKSRLNPVYGEEIRVFRELFLDGDILARSFYKELEERFELYADWLETAPERAYPELATEDLKGWLSSEGLLAELRNKLRTKRENGLVRKDFDELEKLTLFQAHLLELCQNFVAFPDLYNPNDRALFERGTAIMDGREFHLVLPVDDIGIHKQAATRSNMFVLYLEAEGEHFAAPVTTGSQGHLAKLKYGILHHISGDEKVAKVVDLVSNPISFYEALIAPVQKIGTTLKTKIESLSSEKEKELVEGSLSPQKESTKQESSSSGSLLAGGGVAVAALGSSFAFMMKTLASLTPMKFALTFLGLFLAFLIPAGLVAYLKLRNRDLSAVLEGNGWGINDRMKLTSQQAKQFTRQPRHPGFVGSIADKALLVLALVAIIGLCFYYRDSIAILLQ